MTRTSLALAILALCVVGIPPVHAGQAAPAPRKAPLTQAEVEAMVRADASKRLGVAPEAVKVVSTEPRTWKDQALGCGVGRKGLAEEVPVTIPGFLVKVSVGSETLTYHTDRTGRVTWCPAAGKPIDRISK